MSSLLASIHNQGIFLHYRFQFLFRFRFESQFVCRNYSSYSANHHSNDVVNDPQLFVRSVLNQCKLGFSTPSIPIKMFHQLNSLHPRPSIIVFNQLFTAISKIKPHPPFSTIVTLFNQLELSGLRPDLFSVSILTNCYCRLGRVDFGFALLGKHIKLGSPPDIFIVNTLLNGLIASDKLHVAVKLLDKAAKLGIQPDNSSYGVIMKGFCRLGDYSGALTLLRDMECRAPFKPNLFIYNTLIDKLCKDRRLPEALCYFNELKAKGVLLDVVTYGALLGGYCLLGEMDKAENIVSVMGKDGIVPNIVIFNSLLNGYCKSKQVDKAVVMFENMRLGGTRLIPDVFTYNTIIHGLCKDNRLHLALQHFDEMKGRGLAPNVVIYSSLLDGLLKNAWIDRAISLRREMESNGVAPNIYTYGIIINGLYEAGRHVEAVEVVSYLVAKGMRLNVATYNVTIKVLCRQGLLVDAIKLLKVMADNGCPPNEHTYNTIIKEFLNANDVATLDHLDILRSQSFAANANTASLFAGLLTETSIGDTDKALLRKYFLEHRGT